MEIKGRNEAGLQEKTRKQKKESHQGQHKALYLDCSSSYLQSGLSLSII